MRCAILGFVGGAALLQTRGALPAGAVLLACAVLAVLLLLVLLGFCWAALIASIALTA